MILSARDRQIVVEIGRLQPTTYREVQVAVGLRSPNTLVGHIRRLNRMGLVDCDPKRSRTIRLNRRTVWSPSGLVGKWFPVTPVQ